VTFGVTPTGPETGFGYIRMADPLDGMPGARKAARFIEKPVLEAAEAMLAESHHAWNAGIFSMRADRYLDELTVHAPTIYHAASSALATDVMSWTTPARA